MSFVERNNHDLMETLFDINLTLFREYKFVPGSTRLETTPYEVFTSKKGVCQDFANLFICLARLLGIPARYVCGYVYTGNTGTALRGEPGPVGRLACLAATIHSRRWLERFRPDQRGVGKHQSHPCGLWPTLSRCHAHGGNALLLCPGNDDR